MNSVIWHFISIKARVGKRHLLSHRHTRHSCPHWCCGYSPHTFYLTPWGPHISGGDSPTLFILLVKWRSRGINLSTPLRENVLSPSMKHVGYVTPCFFLKEITYCIIFIYLEMHFSCREEFGLKQDQILPKICREDVQNESPQPVANSYSFCDPTNFLWFGVYFIT